MLDQSSAISEGSANESRGGNAAALRVSLARSPSDLKQAQRLRFAVFAQEMGAQLGSAAQGIDEDEFDLYCDHLLVRDTDSGQVVGTYRILPPHRRDAGSGACTRSPNSTWPGWHTWNHRSSKSAVPACTRSIAPARRS